MPDQDGMVPEQFPLSAEVVDRKFYRHRAVERSRVIGFVPPLTLREWTEIAELVAAEEEADDE